MPAFRIEIPGIQLMESGQEALAVVWRRVGDDIEVEGRDWSSFKHRRDAPDDDELDSVATQGFQDVEESKCSSTEVRSRIRQAARWRFWSVTLWSSVARSWRVNFHSNGLAACW